MILDFSYNNNVTIKTGHHSNIIAGAESIINTGSYSTIRTGYNSTITTGCYSTINTESSCTIVTSHCCGITTSYSCAIHSSYGSTIYTSHSCAVIRRDIFEIIALKEDENYIIINGWGVSGYDHVEEIHKIVIDGKCIGLSKESFEELRRQLI